MPLLTPQGSGAHDTHDECANESAFQSPAVIHPQRARHETHRPAHASEAPSLASPHTPSRATCKEPNETANTATQIDTSHALRLARQAFHCLTHCAPHCTSLHANELAGRRTDGLAHDATACAQTAGTRRTKPRRIRHVRQRASVQLSDPHACRTCTRLSMLPAARQHAWRRASRPFSPRGGACRLVGPVRSVGQELRT